MPLIQRHALPNVITTGRIAIAPVIALLLFVPTFTARLVAFVRFLVAAVSDLWDGYLARKHGWISDFGKLVDPIADKLLLIVTLLPFYIISHGDNPHGRFVAIPVFPLWVVLVILGRELLITGIRSYAARRGLIIPAGRSGKLKAVFQTIIIGKAIAWLAALSLALNRGWTGLALWRWWTWLHGFVFISSLALAVLLTLYSLVDYLRAWRKQLRAL
ncbi:MAG: CDP-alcohol phosphatidyltransferase family protein [Gemmatimonadetes bacterium]|nr:CDP-alcohol phosphatidyltransferase family protein [Gemmatimonadota bacterium]